MREGRPSKKSETLEIRLPYDTKQAFMACCRTERRTASEAIRGFIDGQLDQSRLAPARRTSCWRAVTAGMVGALLGIGVAAPSFAHGSEESRAAAFERLDRNHDRVLSYQEFRTR